MASSPLLPASMARMATVAGRPPTNNLFYTLATMRAWIDRGAPAQSSLARSARVARRRRRGGREGRGGGVKRGTRQQPPLNFTRERSARSRAHDATVTRSGLAFRAAGAVACLLRASLAAPSQIFQAAPRKVINARAAADVTFHIRRSEPLL